MADTRGTFRLKNVRNDILNSEYVPLPSVFIANDKFGHGHFFDGQLRRYNISNSTCVLAGSNYFARYDDAGGGSQEHTYWSGGQSNESTISKLVYSTYTTTANLPTKVLTPARNQMASVSKNTDVYYTGGKYPSVPAVSTTQKLTFSNDNIALVPGSPYSPGVNAGMASFNNGGTYGYFWGGVYNPSDTKVIRLTFSNDTMAALPGTTYNSYANYFGMWNMGNTTNGYHVGGGIWQSDTNKLTYANETYVRIPGANYPGNRGRATSFTAGADTGLVNSGRSSSGPGYHSDTNLLTFSTDSWAAAPAMDNPDISPSTYGMDYGTGSGTSARDSKIGGAPSYTEDGSNRWFDGAAQSAPADLGYNRGFDNSPGGDSWVDKLNFSSETVSAGTPSLSSHPYSYTATGDTRNGYLGGNPAIPTEKLNFSLGTWTALPGAPVLNSWSTHGTATSTPSKIYFAGYSSDYSFGVITTSSATSSYIPATSPNSLYYPSTPGTNFREHIAASGNETNGYFIGGYRPGTGSDSKVFKFTYSSETANRVPGLGVWSSPGPANNGIHYHQATESKTAGYVIGGRQAPAATPWSPSYVGKFPFATETYANAGITSPALSGNIHYQYCTGNETKSYMFGQQYVPAWVFNYSTDSGAQVPGMIPARNPTKYYGGSSNMSPSDCQLDRADPPVATPTPLTTTSLNPALNTNAVFAGGVNTSNSGSVNTRSKLTFSNNTMASMPAFTASYNTFGGASSTTRGYLTGAFGNAWYGDTQNKRWYNQYSNDTSGQLPNTDYNAGGQFSVNSETELYSGGGGWSSGQYSYVEKMTFASETNQAVPGMRLQSNLKYCSGIGNKTIGFVGGGNEGNTWRSWISKITYSTATMSASPANMAMTGSSPYHQTMAVGSNTTGYFMCGNASDKLVFNTETVINKGSWSWGGSVAHGNGVSSTTTGYLMQANANSVLTRYPFSTESGAAIPGAFSPNRGRGGAMSSAMFGGAYTGTPNII